MGLRICELHTVDGSQLLEHLYRANCNTPISMTKGRPRVYENRPRCDRCDEEDKYRKMVWCQHTDHIIGSSHHVSLKDENLLQPPPGH